MSDKKQKYCLNQHCEVLFELPWNKSLISIANDPHGEPNYIIVENKYLFDKPTKVNQLIEGLEERRKELEEKERDLEEREDKLEKKTGTKKFGF